MRVLMISTDRTVFESNSATRRRIQSYAQAVGKLEVIVFTLRRDNFSAIHSEHLSLYPTNSISRFFYGLTSFRRQASGTPYLIDTVSSLRPECTTAPAASASFRAE